MKKGLIEIENMEFYAFHGCYHEEKIVGNKFIVNICFETDIDKATQSDNVVDTVNYLEVYETIKMEMMISSNILEHVTERIVNAIAKKFPQIINGSIKVSKCNPPLGGRIEKVSVTQYFTV